MQANLFLVRLLLSFPVLVSCGTTVDVGSNEEEGKKPKPIPEFSADAEAENGGPAISQPGSTIPGLGGADSGDGPGIPNLGGPSGDGGDAGGDGTGIFGDATDSGGDDEGNDDSDGGGDGGGDDGGYPLTCYGPNPNIPYDFQTFCDDIPGDLKTEFATAHKVLCDDQRLINLALYDVCSWHGDQADITRRRKIFDASDATDTSIDWFYMLTAYSLTTFSSPSEHFDLIRREMRDPAFTDTYFQVPNSIVTNRIEYNSNSYSYHVSLANSAATVSFTANLKLWKISDVLSVVFDYAVSDKVIVQEHKYIRFIIDVGDGQSRIVALDEKKINDSGQHNVAYSNLISIIHKRMEKDFENSLRD